MAGTHTLTFYAGSKSKTDQYIVTVEEYEYDMYVIKFHKKLDSNRKFRYNLLTNEFRARKILNTCINIGIAFYQRNPLASFGFIGAPTIDEIESNKFDHTKRFNLYDKFARLHFNPDHFDHTVNVQRSAYLLMNKKKREQEPDLLHKIGEMFLKHYDIDDLYL